MYIKLNTICHFASININFQHKIYIFNCNLTDEILLLYNWRNIKYQHGYDI